MESPWQKLKRERAHLWAGGDVAESKESVKDRIDKMRERSKGLRNRKRYVNPETEKQLTEIVDTALDGVEKTLNGLMQADKFMAEWFGDDDEE